MSTITTILNTDKVGDSRTVLNTNFSNLNADKLGINPALGTPTSGVATNLTGTAAGLTAGNVTGTILETKQRSLGRLEIPTH